MILVGRAALAEYLSRHPAARKYAAIWMKEVEGSAWKNVGEIQHMYPRARVIRPRGVSFEFAEIDLRIATLVSFGPSVVLITNVEAAKQIEKKND